MHPGFRTQMIYTCIVFQTYLLLGITRGFPNFILKKDSKDEDFLSEDDVSWIASLCVFPNSIGSVVGGAMMELYGRIAALRIATILFAICWIVVTFTTNKIVFLTAFIVIGLSAGMTMITGVYVAEISSEHKRGVLLSFIVVFYTSGIMGAYFVTYFFSRVKAAFLFAVLSILILCELFALCESPTWLAKKGKKRKAIVAIRRLHYVSEIEAEQTYEKMVGSTSKIHDKKDLWPVIRNNLKPFSILAWHQSCLQGAGIFPLIAYCSVMFDGLSLPFDRNYLALSFSVAIFISSFFTPFAALYCGRKKLVIFCGVGMTITLLGILAGNELRFVWVIPICTYVFVFFGVVGGINVAETIPSELYSNEVRGLMCGISQAYTAISQGIVLKLFPYFLDRVGVMKVLIMFTVFSVFLTLFGAFVLPETKNKTLQQIQDQYFNKKKDIDVSKDQNYLLYTMVNRRKFENDSVI